jgi:cytochrome c oxidase subunit 2
VNDLHVPFGKPVVIHLRSDDVLHSFYLPHLRVKQDAVPGQIIPVIFEGDKAGQFEIVCAELCGWGHYKMRGQVHIQTDEEFAQYLKDLGQQQFDDGVTGHQPAPPQPVEEEE